MLAQLNDYSSSKVSFVPMVKPLMSRREVYSVDWTGKALHCERSFVSHRNIESKIHVLDIDIAGDLQGLSWRVVL